MKQKLFLVLFALISLTAICANGTKLEPSKTEEPLYITIHKETRPSQPRELIPVTCYYINGILYFDFYNNLGEVEIIVSNQLSGQQYSYIVETNQGFTEIPIISESGNFYLLIKTKYEEYYTGIFAL